MPEVPTQHNSLVYRTLVFAEEALQIASRRDHKYFLSQKFGQEVSQDFSDRDWRQQGYLKGLRQEIHKDPIRVSQYFATNGERIAREGMSSEEFNEFIHFNPIPNSNN